jgi:hypothetical protein
MNAYVLVCGNVFDGISDTLADPAEILVEGDRIARIERSLGWPPRAQRRQAIAIGSPADCDNHDPKLDILA